MRSGFGNRKTRKPKDHPEVEPGTGNVFADLSFPNPEEAQLKAELAGQILRFVRERKLTQAKVAALLGIDQPKVSHLLRGRLALFSTDRLLRFLNALGQDVEIVVRPRPGQNGHASTRVVNG